MTPDNITDPAEKKIARDKIRADWEEEKNSGVENTNYNIDSSGSTPKDTSLQGEVSAAKAKRDIQHHTGGNGNQGNIGSTQHGSSGMTKSQHSAFRN